MYKESDYANSWTVTIKEGLVRGDRKTLNKSSTRVGSQVKLLVHSIKSDQRIYASKLEPLCDSNSSISSSSKLWFVTRGNEWYVYKMGNWSRASRFPSKPCNKTFSPITPVSNKVMN